MYNDGGADWFTGYFFLWLILAVFYLIVSWRIFVKAGKPGWGCLIPIYNIILMLEIVDRPLWWIVLYFIPFINVIAACVISIDLARAFGKDTVFGIGLIFLSFIFMPILAFGDAKYVGVSR